MRYEAEIVWGWPWFGIGYIRCFPNEGNWYTMWMLCLTQKLSIGIHVGGSKEVKHGKGDQAEAEAGRT